MSNVVPFTPRTPDGDWTSGERARLTELADRLMARGARVEVAYGMSDEGDPWCVIQDERDEVLVHVARIRGQFVIHEAAADVVRRADTLWSALKRLLGGGEGAVVELRKAQALLALVMATLFVEEAAREGRLAAGLPDLPYAPDLEPHPGEGHGAVASGHVAWAPEVPHLPAIAQAETQQLAETSPVRGAVAPQDAAPMETPLQAHGAGSLAGLAVAAAPLKAFATPPPEPVSAGGPAAPAAASAAQEPPHLARAAPSGPERFQMAEGVVARGTAGQDVFVINAHAGAPPAFGLAAASQAPASAGVILDFGAGDKLVFGSGVAASIVSVTAVSNVLSDTVTTLSGQPRLAATPGVRVGVDVNGDGVEDAYVMVAGSGVSSLTAAGHGASALSTDAHAEPPAMAPPPPPSHDFILLG